jgi:hypothetical protein
MKHEGLFAYNLSCCACGLLVWVVECYLSSVGFGCRVQLSVIGVCCWLSDRVLTIVGWYRCQWLLLVPAWLSGVDCRVLVVDSLCRMLLIFPSLCPTA